jgi:transposase
MSTIQAEFDTVSKQRDLLKEDLAITAAKLDSSYKLEESLKADLVALEGMMRESTEEASSAYRSLERKHKLVTRKLTHATKHILDGEKTAAEKFALAEGKEMLILHENARLKRKQVELEREKKAFKKSQCGALPLFSLVKEGTQKAETSEDDGMSSNGEEYEVSEADNTDVDLCEGFSASDAGEKLDLSSFPRNSESTISKCRDGTTSAHVRSLDCEGTAGNGRSICRKCSILHRNLQAKKVRTSLNEVAVTKEERTLERVLHLLPLNDQKAVAVKTCLTLQRYGMKLEESASYAASVTGYSERTVREWRNDFFMNEGVHFTASKRGKHSKVETPFDDPVLCKQAKEWVAAHAVVKGEAPMSVFDFAEYCNKELLTPWLAERDHAPFSEDSVRRWLHKLGFSVHNYKKGLYKDGHDDEDAVAHRKWFIGQLAQYDERHVVPLPQYNADHTPADNYEHVCGLIEAIVQRERQTSISGTRPKHRKVDEVEDPHLCTTFPHPYLKSIPGFQFKNDRNIIYGYSDEVIFNTNDSLRSFWAIHGDTPLLKPKSEGQGIMHFDIMLSIGCFLEFLTDEDWKRAEKIRPGVKESAALYFEYGKNRDGYFTSNEFLPIVEVSLFIFHFTFPSLQLVLVFDQSGVHWKKADDALNADHLNLYKPGKHLMRNTSYVNTKGSIKQQVLVQYDEEDEEWKSKPIADILKERGLWKDGMRRDEAVDLLASQPDFAAEKSQLQKLVESYGDVCLAQPKCHPELNPIELVWAGEKYHARKQSKTGIKNLRNTVVSARTHVKNSDPLFLLKCFRKARDFVHVYTKAENALGAFALTEVKRYRSHRRMFNCQLERIRRALEDGETIEEDKADAEED